MNFVNNFKKIIYYEIPQVFKSFIGSVEFGSSVSTSAIAAPKAWSTNTKFNAGGASQNFVLRYANLNGEDLITKEVLQSRVDNFPVIDEGKF